MTSRRLLLVALVVAGALWSAPGLILLGLLAGLADGLSTLWSRHGLDRLTYERRIARPHAVWGDRVEVALTVRNAKVLPIPWFRVDDFATEELTVVDAPLVPSERPGFGILRSTWTLAPYERATRRVHVDADRRGVFELGPSRLSVADVFGRDAATRQEMARATLVVRPRSVGVRAPSAWRASAGTLRSRSLAVTEDPTLFAGVRPFQRGDPRRRIHERASARARRPLSRRYDPSTARTAVIAVDIQTHDGPSWLLAYDEELLESLIVTAASLARDLLASGASVGVAVNGWSRSTSRTAHVPPRAGLSHLATIEDLLARISQTPSIAFESLLGGLPARLPSGSRLIVLTSRDPAHVAATSRRLAAGGHELRFVTMGQRAGAHRRHATSLGFAASVARLVPDWRTSSVLEIG